MIATYGALLGGDKVATSRICTRFLYNFIGDINGLSGVLTLTQDNCRASENG